VSAKFEDMTVERVHVRTASERPGQRGKPLYANRTSPKLTRWRNEDWSARSSR
jgi:hypothetical protein